MHRYDVGAAMDENKRKGVYRVEYEPLEDEGAATELASFEQVNALKKPSDKHPVVRERSPLASTNVGPDPAADPRASSRRLELGPPAQPPKQRDRNPLGRTLAIVDPSLQQVQPGQRPPMPSAPDLPVASQVAPAPPPPMAPYATPRARDAAPHAPQHAAPAPAPAMAPGSESSSRALWIILGSMAISASMILGAIYYVLSRN